MVTKVSYWLIPSQEDRAFFQDMIDTLAREYDAPSFTPHVTIYSGDLAPDESPDRLIEQAIKGVRPFSLKSDRILYSQEFTKTLFVQFQPNSILSQLSQSLQTSSKIPSNYTLNPHLSLIYQQMSEEIKKKLTTSLTLPKSEVLFDQFMAISSPERTQTREDVESWNIICVRKFQL